MAKDPINYKAVVIGGSAGCLEVILQIVTELPVNSGAIFVIVVHRKSSADSILADLLATRTKMTVKEVEDKDVLLPNHVYIAPADYHLLVEDMQAFSLDSSEKVHHSRPSIDVTFESIATVFGSYAVGVLLSGANADGAVGLKKIKEAGGFTIVQDPESAVVDFMPKKAIALNAHTRIVQAMVIPSVLNGILNKK